jgi:hypothetical protein
VFLTKKIREWLLNKISIFQAKIAQFIRPPLLIELHNFITITVSELEPKCLTKLLKSLFWRRLSQRERNPTEPTVRTRSQVSCYKSWNPAIAPLSQRSRFERVEWRLELEPSSKKPQRSHFKLERSHFKLERSHFKLERSHFKLERSHFKLERSHFKLERSHFKLE